MLTVPDEDALNPSLCGLTIDKTNPSHRDHNMQYMISHVHSKILTIILRLEPS